MKKSLTGGYEVNKGKLLPLLSCSNDEHDPSTRPTTEWNDLSFRRWQWMAGPP